MCTGDVIVYAHCKLNTCITALLLTLLYILGPSRAFSALKLLCQLKGVIHVHIWRNYYNTQCSVVNIVGWIDS